MALVDAVGRSLAVNAALCGTTGHSRGELMATTLEDITHPDDVDLDTRRKRDLLKGRIPRYELEARFRHARGHHLWVLVTVSLVRDNLGQPLYLIKQVQDISARKELAAHLAYQVDHDFLTGLSNRRRFEQELAREVRRASRYGSGGALLLIDLDHFKDVNDVLGHKAGDDLLQGVAEALRRRMRQTDVLARVGGDEFAVLLPQTGAEEARIVAAGIVDALSQPVTVVNGSSIRVTASVGVALFDGLRPDAVLAHADLAMYEAKAAGRGRFAMYRAKTRDGGEGEAMSTIDLNAGRLWVERRFEEIAREFGAPRRLTREDRWREHRSPLVEQNQSMAYYIEIGGRLKRGEVTFSEDDLEVAGAGEPSARERLGRQIRNVLGSNPAGRE
jgi:diguanylate cyclase (GGDEF)-like protein/PAS domain S-box-containing protein